MSIMEEIQETFSALKQFSDEFNRIIISEILEADQMLCNLMEDIVNVEESEFGECKVKLHSLEQEVLSLEKKEFSLLKVFDIEYNEQAHSSFLAWLLDPQGDHDLSERFVYKFISQVVSKTKELNVSRIDFKSLRVDREIPSDESRLDIRIKDPSGSFLCIIENKIFSGEGVDQTNRLYRDFHNPAVNELFVFLSLNERMKPKNSNFIHMTYREILSIIKSLLKETTNHDAKYLISHYANTLERIIMSQRFECFSERTKLYYKYQKYIEEVRKAFDQDRKLLLSTLEEEVKRRQWWNDKTWKMDRTGDSIAIWKDAWYPDEHQGVYIELYLHTSQPAFSLFIYGEPSEFSMKFGPVLQRLLGKELQKNLIEAYTITFQKGVSRFIRREIPLSLTEKGHVQKIVESLDEMVETFGKTIDRSIEEFRRSSS
jgi:hypothetical protein